MTVAFWTATTLIAGAGETASDFLFQHLAPPIVLVGGLVGLIVALVLQLRARRYLPWIYWPALAMAAVFGTMPADVVRVGMDASPIATIAVFLVVLVVIFLIRHLRKGTLSIHDIGTRGGESFYWAALLAIFALGTAAADMTANTLHMGFLLSAVAFGVVIAILSAARKWFGLNATAALWLGCVFVRPFGASLADWLAYGLHWGSGPVTSVLAIVIISFVGFLARRRS
jgi:uncharacterized membrane-anchored protein